MVSVREKEAKGSLIYCGKMSQEIKIKIKIKLTTIDEHDILLGDRLPTIYNVAIRKP